MKVQGAENLERVPMWALPADAALCPGCGDVYVMGGYCSECRRHENVLAREYAAWEERSRRRRDAELRRAFRRRRVFQMRCRRKLEGWAACIGCIAILYWFLWETRSWWLELFQIWFGGN